jgi:hypothetical protein
MEALEAAFTAPWQATPKLLDGTWWRVGAGGGPWMGRLSRGVAATSPSEVHRQHSLRHAHHPGGPGVRGLLRGGREGFTVVIWGGGSRLGA